MDCLEALLDSTSVLIFSTSFLDISINKYGLSKYDAGKRKPENKYVELGNIRIQSSKFMEILHETQDLLLALQRFSLEQDCAAVETVIVMASVTLKLLGVIVT